MLPDNKSFCAVPFVSIMVNTDTTVRYCCMVKGAANKIKKDDGSPYTCKDRFIDDAWNSKDMRDIRKAMIAGEKIEGCSVCYLQEDSGRVSNRQHSINEWKWKLGEDALYDKVKQALDNDGVVKDDIVYLDLRLGNLCNLKCRMCNPWNSSQIAKEHLSLKDTDKAYADVWKKTFGTFPLTVLDDQQWFDHDILWDQVISLIPTLKKVYMTGGEPTLIKNNFKFMQSCLEQGRKDILLFFNTNCTNLNKNFFELISQFDQVHINASMDGIGEVNEYIRSPSNWKQINENIERLASLPNVVLGITPTVQVYNIFDLTNIVKYVNGLNVKYSKKIFIDFLINVHPHHLSVTILPEDIKQAARLELIEYKNHMVDCPEMTMNSLEGIIGLLANGQSVDAGDELTRLSTYTKSLDASRGQSFTVLDNRLWRVFQ